MNGANEVHGAASAIVAFQLAQLAFAALVKKGILPKAEAEQILRQAIEAMRTAGPGDRAAELLAYSPCRGSSRFHAASGVGNAGTARRKAPTAQFEHYKAHVFYWIPPNIRATIGLSHGDIAEIPFPEFRINHEYCARAIAKIARWCSTPRKFILKSVIPSCSEAPTTPGAIARTDPAGLPFHHMTAHNDGKILIADRHTHRFCSIPAATGLERRPRADVV